MGGIRPVGKLPRRTDTGSGRREEASVFILTWSAYSALSGISPVCVSTERYNLPFVSSCQMSVAEGEFRALWFLWFPAVLASNVICTHRSGAVFLLCLKLIYLNHSTYCWHKGCVTHTDLHNEAEQNMGTLSELPGDLRDPLADEKLCPGAGMN